MGSHALLVDPSDDLVLESAGQKTNESRIGFLRIHGLGVRFLSPTILGALRRPFATT